MLFLSISRILMLTILLLAGIYQTDSAPTHHLTIGVQGNTPTLIVSSSEVGITPQTMDSNKQFVEMETAAKSDNISEAARETSKGQSNNNPLIFKNLEQSLANATNTALLAEEDGTTLNAGALEITTVPQITPAAEEDSKVSGESLLFTNLATEQNFDVPLVVEIAPEVSPTQLQEMSTLSPLTSTHTTPPPLTISDKDNLHIFSTFPATQTVKDFEDISTTLSNDENTDTVTTIDFSIQTPSEQENKVNDVAVQVQKIINILPDKSDLKMENEDGSDSDSDSDSDSNTQTQVPTGTTENGNVLLTTIETNSFATTSTANAVLTPSDSTLITENAETTTKPQLMYLPLTIMTTATSDNVVDNDTKSSNDNNGREPSITEYTDIDQQGLTNETGTTETGVEEISNQSQKDGFVLKSKQQHNYTTTRTQKSNNEVQSTESSVSNKMQETNHKYGVNNTARKSPQRELQTEVVITTADIGGAQSITVRRIELQPLPTLETSRENHKTLATTTTTDQPHNSSNSATTTEAVLKLIDLEKHVLKTIDELKQPSLLMSGQHDNGHDGLKNIKKKQLVDKHYVEALLHNRQDLHMQNEKYLNPTAQIASKPVLTPIKHGYLGPILMEEKTFHVIHHTDNITTNNNQHLDAIENQLRNGHFVELKAKEEAANATKFKYRTNFSTEEKIMRGMETAKIKTISKTNNFETTVQTKEQSSLLDDGNKFGNSKEILQKSPVVSNQRTAVDHQNLSVSNLDIAQQTEPEKNTTEHSPNSNRIPHYKTNKPAESFLLRNSHKISSGSELQSSFANMSQKESRGSNSSIVLSTTVFQVLDSLATKTPTVQAADTLFTAEERDKTAAKNTEKQQVESKISDIQIEVYDSTIDSLVASTNGKDIDIKHQTLQMPIGESYLGRTTKPPVAALQQERFTQYVIDRIETSTHEPINYNTIQVASGKPEPAAIEIHINVSESFANESEDVQFSFPQTDDSNNNKNNDKIAEEAFDGGKISDNIKLKIPSNGNGYAKESINDEILVVEVLDTDNDTSNNSFKGIVKNNDEFFITDVKDVYTTPPHPPPPPPYHQSSFDRDSDTIFYISNTEVKVGESLPATKNADEERKLRLESQFFPANYMASTHPNLNNAENLHPTHHLYEEDIILSPSRNQADSLKIYRNNNEPAPPLDVTYVGESIIEVEQSPELVITTTFAPDQQHHAATLQPDVIIQPAILPEISIGVPVIGELPPQLELKEIDFMPSEAQLHRSGIYDDNDIGNNNNYNDNAIDENTITGNSNNHDVDAVSGNSNQQRVDESSIQYGGDLIDESADGGFDGVEGSYPFGNPAVIGKSAPYSYSSAFFAKLRRQQQLQQQRQQQEQQKGNHVADYAHLYVNYGVNNMRKDELSADVKDSGEMLLIGNGSNGNTNLPSNEQNTTSFKDFLSKVGMSNFTMPFMNSSSTHSERMSNATAFSVMEDANDLENRNTEDIVNLISLAIGLFIVILPVVVTCSMFWALRYLYKKYHSSLTDNGGYTDQTETKIPLDENSIEKGEFNHAPSSSPTNSFKDTIEKYLDTSNKPSTTDSSVKFCFETPNPHIETLPSNTDTGLAYSTCALGSKTNETFKHSLALSFPMTQEQGKPPPSASSPLLVVAASKYSSIVYADVVSEDDDDGDDDDVDVEISGPNGSITKMTLENNLLIVETEQRNDISRVARETKMDYNKKGVFVVEVARGIDSRTIPESPLLEGNDKMLSMFDTTQNGGLAYKMANEKNYINNEKVQIHSPPAENHEDGPRSLHQIEEVEEPINSPQPNDKGDTICDLVYKANTGLSQSDVSSTSSNDSNKGYSYGNQELYIVEEKSYTCVRPTENVVLKCDIKDINDDDPNPGSDRYLTHSPNRNEELNKSKDNFVGTLKKAEEGESRTNSGESPEQKQNDKVPEQMENDTIIRSSLQVEEGKEYCATGIETMLTQQDQLQNIAVKSDLLNKIEIPAGIIKHAQSFTIPVEIEVHLKPVQDDDNNEETGSAESEELPILEETQNGIPPSKSESLYEPLENTSIPKPSNADEIAALGAPDKFSDNETSQGDMSANKISVPLVCALNNGNELKEECESSLNGVEEINGNLKDEEPESENREGNNTTDNVVASNKKIPLYLNGTIKADDKKNVEEEKLLDVDNEVLNTEQRSGLLLNNTDALNGQREKQETQNDHLGIEQNGNCLSEIENGYDSILSLPEPPPATDDLSEQQMDSLPPPPPPEIFNLKDLPPPLTNGNANFSQSEDPNSFYQTLPPPPPTTLQVTLSAEATTAGNRKVHASPLTPPASPPAHFTNNLHAGLCSQPIAVDVNGS